VAKDPQQVNHLITPLCIVSLAGIVIINAIFQPEPAQMDLNQP
jgi:hypothetical protein